MKTERQPLPRAFIIIAFGPLVGAAVMTLVLVTAMLLDGGNMRHLPYGVGLFMSFGYVAGFLPALAAALLWRFVPPDWSLRRRALAAVLIGAVTSAVLVWPFMALFLSFIPPNPLFAGLAALCGAVALCATALPGGHR